MYPGGCVQRNLRDGSYVMTDNIQSCLDITLYQRDFTVCNCINGRTRGC